MQAELSQSHPDLNITLLAINQINAESGINNFNEGHNLPMVQDSTSEGIWTSWEGGWRDVYILDSNNELIEIYNLTTYNIQDTDNYNTLKEKLISAAQQ